MRSAALFVLCLVSVMTPAASAEEWVWIEGEAPSQANVKVPPNAWDSPSHLSKQAWAGLAFAPGEVQEKVPADGVVLRYRFQAPRAGTYEVWGRIGMDAIRSPFDWRIDQGPWDTITRYEPEDLATDLQELGYWKSIGWVHMGRAKLSKGEHELVIRVPIPYRKKEGKKVPDRLIFTADAFCIHAGQFLPNGKHKPGADFQTKQDKAAGRKVYRLGQADQPRLALPLAGLWQMARFDVRGLVEGDIEDPTPLPTHPLHWQSMKVPGDRHAQRPDLVFNHRYFLRTRVDVPADHAGRSFVLDIADLSCYATVYVNAKPMGHRTIPFAPWKLDITAGIQPGKVNEIWVGIKDRYYALRGGERHGHKNARYLFFTPVNYLFENKGITNKFIHPVRNSHANGLLDRVELISTGPVYAENVFAKPDVEDHRLAAEISLANSSDRARTVTVETRVEPWKGDRAVLSLPKAKVRVPAGGEKRVEFRIGGQNKPLPLKLWWPDDPQLYRMVTTVKDANGRIIDVARTRFGYRTWRVKGTRFTLNGIPWQMRADLTGYGGSDDPEELVRTWRRNGQTMMRLRFQRGWGPGWTQREVLEFMDEQGVPVRRTLSTFDGQHASYGLTQKVEEGGRRKKVARKELFDNWRDQMRARLRIERNHACVFMWELDNEIVYINTRNFGNLEQVEPEFTQASEMIQRIDPTRNAVNVAGGRALLDQSLPVNGCHYEETDPRDYPDMAYGLGKWVRTTDKQPWPMDLDKPIFLGETYFASGWDLGKLAKIGGEQCFLGRPESRPAVALMARMFSEGYRRQNLGGFHFWFSSPTSGAGHYTSWQPVAVFCRQWNWTFASGAKVQRLLRVLNDTRFETPITARYELVIDAKRVDSGEKTFRIAPGEGSDWPITPKMPETPRRLEGTLTLTAVREGKEVFRDVKKVSVIDPDAAQAPKTAPGELLLWDPKGNVAARLTRRGVDFTPVTDLHDVEEAGNNWRVLLVGPDALQVRDATDRRWRSMAARGKRIVVLDQKHPLHYQAVPADFDLTDYTGTIAFIENADHPIFAGLAQKDFRTFSGDHVVYRNVYAKASRGARSLLQCDTDLNFSAIAECPVQQGILLLCQALVGSKIDSDPVAQRLLDQMLNYALTYRLSRKPTALVATDQSRKNRMLEGTGVNFTRRQHPSRTIDSGDYEIVVVDATAENLSDLARNVETVREFTAAGGWLMLWGVTPEGLADFNKLVGVEHLIRPFRVERVRIPTPRDPLLAGLSQRDVVMSTGRKIQRGSANEHPSGHGYTYVMDYRDVAPFAHWPSAKEMGKPSGGNDHNPMNMVNGFDDALNWRYAFTFIMERGDRTTWSIRLPREETLVGFQLDPRDTFRHILRMKLTFDDDPSSAVEVDVRDPDTPQNWDFTPRKARKVTFDITRLDNNIQRNLTGLDNLRLLAKRSDAFLKKVKPLLNIPVLVKYPHGKGGIVLNQVRPMESEPLPINAQKKKALVAMLLQNLGAAFSGQRTLLPGAGLRYTPISTENAANLYLTSADGWPDNDRDLSHLPLASRKFAGVNYHIRDFKTSPLESAVTVGPRRGAKAPTNVEIQADVHADVLFFLHTMVRKRTWKPRRRQDQPPTLWNYVVRYADGKTLRVPVVYGRDVDHYVQTEPKGLKGAALAWAAAFPKDPANSAALWSMQWNNPRAEVKIRSVTMQAQNTRYANGVLLAVTAATAPDSPEN
jgi:beta-galactosidase